MRRWHQEIHITRRNWRNHRRIHVESNLRSPYGSIKGDRIGKDPYEVDCECDDQIGRFRKKDAYDCGQTMCRVCHYEKWLLNGGHEPTRQEEASIIKMIDGIKELEEDASQT